MSGAGGGGYESGAGGEAVSCNIVVSDIVLQNVDEDALLHVAIGDELEVRLEESSPIVVREDAFVGSVFYGGVARLIRCLRDGYDYIAHVTDINESDKRCVVTIRNA